MKIEIVVYTIEGALRAQEGGADRIELCADPGAGGTTPSFGTIEVVRQNINLDLYVMLRPRGGNFDYSSYEFHAMKRDLWQCQKLSVDGVVLGILNQDGTLDKKRCRELIERSRPLKVTCHRAFDQTRDPFEALEDCIEVGFDRILTSGQKKSAYEGRGLISRLREAAGNRIGIIAGAGINESTVREIVTSTKVSEIHFSATTYHKSNMMHNDLSMGSDSSHEFDVRTVDPQIIKNVRQLATSNS